MKTKNLESQVDELAALNYTIVLRNDDDGDVIAAVKEFAGCIAHGQDAMEALGNLESMKRLWIESCLKDGGIVPLPIEEEDDLPSGKWLLRVPRNLHRKLIEAAKNDGVSLNSFVTYCLAEAVGARLPRMNTMSHFGIIKTIKSEAAAGATRFGCWNPSANNEGVRSGTTIGSFGDELYANMLIQHLAPSTSQISERPRRDYKETPRSLAYQA